jgi:hypothetical protein
MNNGPLQQQQQQQREQSSSFSLRAWTRQVLFASYMYRQVNRIESFLKTGFPNESNLQSYWKKGQKIVQQRKQAFFTGAHQTTNWERFRMYVQRAISEKLLDQVCCIILENNGSCHRAEKGGISTHKPLDWETCVNAIQKLPGIGPFVAWQIACDLQESGCIAFQEVHHDIDYQYCELGPGAKGT